MRTLLAIFCVISAWPTFVFSQTLQVQSARKEIQLTGYTHGIAVVNVSSEVSGKVLAVNYDVGQVIGEQPFSEIDPTFIDFQIESAEQSIEKLNITIVKMDSSIGYLKKEFVRFDTLHKGDRATEVQRDTAANRLEQAQHERDAVMVEKALLNIHLDELKERKKRHKIFAPKGWRVVHKNVEVGDIINVNTPLAKVSDYRRLVVPLFVSVDEYRAIKALTSPFDAQLEGTPIKAMVNWVNPEFNEKTRKLGIELKLAQYAGEKRGGLRFKLPLSIQAEGLLVPKAAVENRYENPKVMREDTGESVRIIIIGENNGDLLIADNPRLEVGTKLKVR